MVINKARSVAIKNRQKLSKQDELKVCNKENSLHNGKNVLEENLERQRGNLLCKII